MFDVSFSELLMVGVIALIVIGPERLPKVARTIGHLIGRAQRYVSDVKTDIQQEMDLEEIGSLKGQLQDAANSIKETVKKSGDELRQPLQEAQDALQDASESLADSAKSIETAAVDTDKTAVGSAASAGSWPELPAESADPLPEPGPFADPNAQPQAEDVAESPLAPASQPTMPPPPKPDPGIEPASVSPSSPAAESKPSTETRT